MQDDDDVSDEDTLPGTPVRRRTRVLVVDDDWAMRELVATRLEEEGYDVREAESGRDLLATLEKITADAWPFDGVDQQRLRGQPGGNRGLGRGDDGRRRVLGDSGGATRRKERGQNENRRSGPRDHSGEPAPREGAPVRNHRTPSRRRASGVKSASVRCRWKLCGVLSL
jgi:hypothetical protein